MMDSYLKHTAGVALHTIFEMFIIHFSLAAEFSEQTVHLPQIDFMTNYNIRIKTEGSLAAPITSYKSRELEANRKISKCRP